MLDTRKRSTELRKFQSSQPKELLLGKVSAESVPAQRECGDKARNSKCGRNPERKPEEASSVWALFSRLQGMHGQVH